ncbi:allophanate hydrolase [Pueribacillus theae]|uniref:Allophanate hydrolase n=1 Tax=Pueribacillus theae TaxID=2171751 RepID=A0A2U1K5P5_9BACI|nr:5-oxoprolinase subunit PxpB [Pueribacillus theae]PWA12840.1 allophanate hydrolase [Pueribacillus theae]
MGPTITPIGDCGIRIHFGDEVSVKTNQKIIAYKSLLEKKDCEGITDIVPGYTTLSLFYDPSRYTYKQMFHIIEEIHDKVKIAPEKKAVIYHIPTCYGEPYGVDLHVVAKCNGISPEEVIAIHSGKNYYIYMLGFLPGFPYLGGLEKRIATPRLDTPRLKVPAGSVGIAGEQTGIYPLDSPGGWRIIGRTPVKLFEPEREPSILFEAGNYIRFEPIEADEFHVIIEKVENAAYRIKTTEYVGG